MLVVGFVCFLYNGRCGNDIHAYFQHPERPWAVQTYGSSTYASAACYALLVHNNRKYTNRNAVRHILKTTERSEERTYKGIEGRFFRKA